MGGMCTLIGTSTNLVVNGILIREGYAEIDMFQMTGLAAILLVVGVGYMVFVGLNILPDRREEPNLGDKFGMKDYLTDFEIISGSKLVGQKIMDSNLVKKLDMDILEVLRSGSRFNLPPGDFELRQGDVLKVRCSAEKIQALKSEAKIIPTSDLAVGDHRLNERSSTIVEMVITTNAALKGFTLRGGRFPASIQGCTFGYTTARRSTSRQFIRCGVAGWRRNSGRCEIAFCSGVEAYGSPARCPLCDYLRKPIDRF